MNAEEPSIVVISGAQGAGKTTIATLLARRFPRCAVVNGGEIQKLIVSGLVWPSGAEEADASGGEFERQLRVRLQASCAIARVLVDAGFTTIIEEQVVGARVDHLLQDLRGRAFRFVMLAPSHQVVVTREHGRGTTLHERWGSWEEEINERTPKVGLWVDTSEQSPAETLSEIVRCWDEALVRDVGYSPA